MPKEIDSSLCICDCGYQFDFSLGTVTEVKAASMERKQALIADDGLHEVIFDQRAMIGIHCPRRKTRRAKKTNR